MPGLLLDLDWAGIGTALRLRGWVRRRAAIGAPTLAELIEAAPGTWSRQEDDVFGVRQGGMICGAVLHQAAPLVRELATAVIQGLAHGVPALPTPPSFTDVSWTRDEDGSLFISPHRDPPTAGGVIAVVTLYGASRFSAWDGDGKHEWETETGDLVLMRGKGWPTEDAECPFHEASPPVSGGRMIMTLRHNTLGPGADYFAPLRAQ